MTPEQEKALHDAQLTTPKSMLRRLRADVKRMVQPKPIPRKNDDYNVMRLDIGDVADAVATIRRDAGGVEGATMDYTKLTLAELRNGISDTKSAIHRCKEALDNLRHPKTVGLQAMADAITHLLPRLEQDLKALEKAYIAKSVSRG
jgi:hypothetical protein